MGHHFVAFDFAKICRALYESEGKEKFEAPILFRARANPAARGLRQCRNLLDDAQFLLLLFQESSKSLNLAKRGGRI